MAKVHATVYVRGVDAGAMLAEGLRRLAELADARWQVEEAFFNADVVGSSEMIAADDGMMPLWGGQVTGVAEIDPAGGEP